jgi:choline dehydrogenase-like flavoprotein
VDGREAKTIRKFVRHADAYLQQRGIARLRVKEELLHDDCAFLLGLRDTYHQCGGLRMTNSPATGVVDRHCRVWGTTNVFVSGASVFPTSSHANCTLTSLALSARLAATITDLR